jgi:hypothetical protein
MSLSALKTLVIEGKHMDLEDWLDWLDAKHALLEDDRYPLPEDFER